MSAECTQQGEIAAFLADELDAPERAAFENHLANCAACRAELVTTRAVVQRLHAAPQLSVTRDLAPGILARLHEEETVVEFPWRRVAALAAAVAVCAGSVALWLRSGPEASPEKPRLVLAAAPAPSTTDTVARAIDWLCQAQESDGSWDAEKWGGQQRFRIALTALPAMAILNSGAPSPERTAAIERAITWLRQQQGAAGTFGPDFQGAPYNQSIATLALLHLYRQQPSAELKRSVDAALAVLQQRQSPEGAWGYLHSPFGDRSITAWHVEALEMAGSLGWENVTASRDRGRTWLAAHIDARTDHAEPADSPSAALIETAPEGGAVQRKLDFYGAYFLTAAAYRASNAISSQQLAEVRENLVQSQVVSGETAGSWAPVDRWGRAGGRLYSTALASLSLEQP